MTASVGRVWLTESTVPKPAPEGNRGDNTEEDEGLEARRYQFR